ncbi:hypothetical protein P170DRAFT_353068 [Aspergillus steynii IBT 23096]|uniref:DNA replication regulator SLD2 n=1 Tax=Aspergillus steynii IBT 23096 TaxID=1392250 RepID=A0A2I2GIR4_9EURO|nr:uncharacterized protein P170DRAFT_353068 [Aspergillus steynii IBT 23096]PLB52773.1 hypothetical protein P170DRAFT_353068 [Aspergillus steynii IBT 23096]
MADLNTSEIVALSGNLRAELKEWERAFAAANEGRKAERNDIKQVPEIAAKYKEYSRLKSLEKSSKYEKKHRSNHPQAEEQRPKKRKHASPTGPGNDHHTTPRKTTKGLFETPSKSRKDNAHSSHDLYDSPSVFRKLFSPSTHMHPSPLKAAIGPTPQRDGKALGLFDLLSESGGSTATPSATRIASVRGEAAQTPSKRRTMDTIAEEDEEEEDGPRGERTPASSGKKYMLSNLFATPTTLRYAAMVENENDAVHADGEKQHQAGENAPPAESETPSFLRRSNPARYGLSNSTGNAGGLSPMAVRKPPQFVGKGLSAIVRGLRDMEDERMQDDLDVLNEIEAEQAAAANVEVTDSQVPDNPNGRTYKKKGQKRTTRRVNMKPVIAKPTVQAQIHSPEPPEESDDDHEEHEEPAAVPETQRPNIAGDDDEFDYDGFDDIGSLHTMSDPDLDSDPEYGEKSKPATKGKSFSEKMKEAIGEPDPQPRDPQEKAPPKAKASEPKKPRERKVNPQAHANYRSLKIRSRGSKGRGAGRFGRRR